MIWRVIQKTVLADNGNVNSGNFANVGGNYNNTNNAGPFYANFNNSASNSSSNVGSRLSMISEYHASAILVRRTLYNLASWRKNKAVKSAEKHLWYPE